MQRHSDRNPEQGFQTIDRFSIILGRSRFIVLFAVIAVMLVAVSLFLFGTIQALVGIWNAWKDIAYGNFATQKLSVEFLEIVSTMLKAVVFYLIGVGLYSLFIAQLNITVSLGVDSLNDLEAKVISVVVVILGVTFLEHFISWRDPLATLEFGGAAALVVVALVWFELLNHRAKQEQTESKGEEHARARHSMFARHKEKADVAPVPGSGDPASELPRRDKPDG